MFDPSLLRLAEAILADAKEQGLKIAVAESCTGGQVAAYFTEIPGSSAVFDRGFVTYSNDAKMDMLGVPKAILNEFGAVSEPCARAMAAGVLDNAPEADLAVSITGVAGPGGGSDAKPVGLVHFGCVRRGRPVQHDSMLFGDPGRAEIRRLAVAHALGMLHRAL
jgi:nicotinamide-nucleotide amidase